MDEREAADWSVFVIGVTMGLLGIGGFFVTLDPWLLVAGGGVMILQSILSAAWRIWGRDK